MKEAVTLEDIFLEPGLNVKTHGHTNNHLCDPKHI